MVRRVVFTCIVVLMPTVVFCQNLPSSPSLSILNSGSMLRSDRDLYFSLRMEALGVAFGGLVTDHLTDLYRNPAYFGVNDRPLLFGDLIRPRTAQYGYHVVIIKKPVLPRDYMVSIDSKPLKPGKPFAVRSSKRSRVFDLADVQSSLSATSYYPTSSSTPIGVRAGYVGKFGVLIRGYYSQSTDQSNNANEGINPGYYSNEQFRSSFSSTGESESAWGDVQLSYGWSLSENFSAGASYTFSINDYPNRSAFSRSEFRLPVIINGYDSTTQVEDDTYNRTDRMIGNILRAGILMKDGLSSWDAVATVEFLSHKITNAEHRYSNYYESYQRNSTYPDFSLRQRSALQDFLINSDVQTTNAGLDIQYKNVGADDRTLTAQLGVGISDFSSNDQSHTAAAAQEYYRRPYDTLGFNAVFQGSIAGKPDGFGFVAHGALGWTLRANDFLLAIAGVANYWHLKYDYDQRKSISDLAVNVRTSMGRDSVYYDRAFSSETRFLHQHNATLIRVAIPIGMEFELIKNLHVRAGWVVEFVRNVNQEKALDQGYRFTNNAINFSTVSFGMGYQIVERLRADFVNLGDIAQPRDWNISVMYTP
ncbi:MAG: hypothetical protein HY277_03065 [Ignavibacteriales bacterium]|nr:hypothetical protein [Ignavibacteriales bacterium]